MERNPFLLFYGESTMNRRRRGMALVLVMTVILALSVIATPFVLSMILQERGARTARCEAQARYGVDGAKNFAHWALMNGVESLERRSPSGPFRSYYYDTLDELQLTTAAAVLPSESVLNPRGSIWGVTVQDEQGKLNLRTAPLRAIRNLTSMAGNTAANPRDFVTIYSGRDAAWVFPQRIRSLGEKPLPDDPNTTYYGASVDSAFHFGTESRVRVSKQGLRPMIATVKVNGLNAGRGNTIETEPMIPATYADGIVEVESRHPVNVNTARPEVLLAVFEGVRVVVVEQGVTLEGVLDRSAAGRLAMALAGGRVERLESFFEILAGLDLSPEQKLAAAINAVDPACALLQGSGTVPLGFKTYDVYTFDSYASQNSPAGAQVAGRGSREVVSVSPPVPLSLHVESQYDFDRMCAAGTALANYGGRFGNFPYGNRIITFPVLVTAGSGLASDTALKPQQTPGPNGNEAYVQIKPASDYRGEFPQEYRNLLQAVEHFDDTHEGLRMAGPRTYSWDKVFGPTPVNAGSPAEQWPSVAQGGFEMWARFDAVTNPMTIFDIREQDWLNRLTLRVENGELILTACDATIGTAGNPTDNGAAEIRQPFLPQPDTWYHFGAYWKGNHYTGLALLVDGFAHPQQKFRHVNPESPPNTGVITKLGAALTANSTALSIMEDSWIPPWPTALRVGDEVIVYDKASGTVERGARGTNPTLGTGNYQPNTGKEHPAQATVSLFGYSSKLRRGTVRLNLQQQGATAEVIMDFNRLTRGQATILYNFGEHPDARVAGDKQDPTGTIPVWFVDETQTEIGVDCADIMAYPDQGYIRIEQEVIFYTGRTTGGVGGKGNAKFTGCTRGCKGSGAARHLTGRRVELWCVPVSGYADYLSPTIIQAEEEWFGPLWKDPERPNYWIPFDGQNFYPLIRGGAVFGSKQSSHAALEKVIPTFIVRESDPGVNFENLGRWDVVTIQDAANNREQARVRRVSAPGWSGIFSIAGAGSNPQLVGLWDFVSREYVPDDLHVRVLKFPSGELLSLSWLQAANPSFTIGPFEGKVDEIKFFGSRREAFSFSSAATLNDTQASVAGQGGPRKGGLIKAGDEYLGYGDRQNNQLSLLKRGWLNSARQVHDAGDRILDLSSYIPVSALTGDVTPTDRTIPIAQRLAGDDRQYRRGYVLIDNEVILFEWGGGNGRPLDMPPRWDGQTGLYRGMFGTVPAAHSANQSLVYGIPFRFWDTYKPHEFDNRMAYFQWSAQLDLAKWHALGWTQEIPGNDPHIAVHALVRLDGKGELYNPAGQNDDQLVYDFANGGAPNPINRIGWQKEAGLIDVRFVFEYRKGAFDSQNPWDAHAWKKTPKIKDVTVTYDRPSKTLYHEDR